MYINTELVTFKYIYCVTSFIRLFFILLVNFYLKYHIPGGTCHRQSSPCCISVCRSRKAAPRRPWRVCRLRRKARMSSSRRCICTHLVYRSSLGMSTPRVLTGALTLARTTEEKFRTISLSALHPHCMYLSKIFKICL